MDQKTFDSLREQVERDVATEWERSRPTQRRPILSQMQVDAGMSGCSADESAIAAMVVEVRMCNYVAGANQVLERLAVQYELKYEPLKTPRIP